MRAFLITFLIYTATYSFVQAQDVYQINVKTLVVHSKPEAESKVVGELKKGDAFVILSVNKEWHEIKFGKKTGFILGPSLNQSEFWTKRVAATEKDIKGVCDDFTPKYNYDLNNYFQLNAGEGRDIVVKLMKKNNGGKDECIRSVYVEANSELKIRNIPEGVYYVKVAYGNGWELRNINSICYGKFEQDAIYEKGVDLFDYNVVKTDKGHQVPSYQLTLEIISNNPEGKVVQNQISEEEFNN